MHTNLHSQRVQRSTCFITSFSSEKSFLCGVGSTFAVLHAHVTGFRRVANTIALWAITESHTSATESWARYLPCVGATSR